MATPAEVIDTPAMGTETEAETVTPDKSSEDLRAELARTAAALKKANDEAKKHRLRKEELEQAESERNEAKLSDEERHRKASEAVAAKAKEAESEVARLREENLSLKINEKVKDEARKKGFEYPELVPAMIGREKIVIEDDGAISGIEKAVERLAKDYPNLIAATGGGGSPQAIRQRQVAGQAPRTYGRVIDQADQELRDLRPVGRM